MKGEIMCYSCILEFEASHSIWLQMSLPSVNCCCFSGYSVSPKILLGFWGQRSDCIIPARFYPWCWIQVYNRTFIHLFWMRKSFDIRNYFWLSAFQEQGKIKYTVPSWLGGNDWLILVNELWEGLFYVTSRPKHLTTNESQQYILCAVVPVNLEVMSVPSAWCEHVVELGPLPTQDEYVSQIRHELSLLIDP